MIKTRTVTLTTNEQEVILFDQLKEASMARTDAELIRIMMRECAKIFLPTFSHIGLNAEVKES